jgi:hypothetical protein
LAARNSYLHPDLKSLSQLENCSVESDEPDPRGWSVFTSSGRQIGTVIDLLIEEGDRAKAALHVRYLVIDIDGGALPGISASGSTALVRVEDIDLDGGSQRVTARAIACSDIHRAQSGITVPPGDPAVTTM